MSHSSFDGDQSPHQSGGDSTLSRRAFLKGAGGIAAGSAAAGGVLASEGSPTSQEPEEGPVALEGEVEVEFLLNGVTTQVKLEPRTTLLRALRSHLQQPHTGAKDVCDRGTCGACTVLLDDEPVYACMTLAVSVQGRSIRTVEGLADGEELTPVQSAMVAEDGTMCGFCTPGFVMSVTSCLEKNPSASQQQVREACSGNLCRCGTYPHIIKAALAAGSQMKGESR